ncbi:hypothetical protein ABK040_016498 [Willaertia magna]
MMPQQNLNEDAEGSYLSESENLIYSLCEAAYQGDSDLVRKCIEKNPRAVNEFYDYDENMGDLVRNNNILQLFFEISKPFVNLPDYEGHTPLILATNSHQYKTMKYLIEKGANINHQDEAGMNALHVAASNGDLQAVKILLEAGISKDASVRGQKNQTPEVIAEMYNFSEVAQFIRDYK